MSQPSPVASAVGPAALVTASRCLAERGRLRIFSRMKRAAWDTKMIGLEGFFQCFSNVFPMFFQCFSNVFSNGFPMIFQCVSIIFHDFTVIFHDLPFVCMVFPTFFPWCSMMAQWFSKYETTWNGFILKLGMSAFKRFRSMKVSQFGDKWTNHANFGAVSG